MFNVPSNSRENCTVNDKVFLLNELVLLFLFRSKSLIVSRKKSVPEPIKFHSFNLKNQISQFLQLLIQVYISLGIF